MSNLAVMIGVAGTIVGVLLAAFSLGMSRSPVWSERRHFALVAVTAAGYSAFDLALVLDVSPAAVAASVQIALAFGALHGAAWLRYLAAADRRLLTTLDRWAIGAGVVIAIAGLVPGLLITREIVAVTVAWVGITYRTPQPTLLGGLVYGYFCFAMVVIATRAWRRRHDGWYGRLPIIGVMTLGALAINDTLSSAGVIAMPLLLDAGSMIVVLVTGFIHERRFADDVHRLERASNVLKQEVAMRTRELLDAQDALARDDRLAGLGRLAAGVAHEINNPIAVVQHNLERLRAVSDAGVALPTGVPGYVESALAATYRVVRVVRQLLDAGRAIGPDLRRLEPFHIAPVVRRALSMTKLSASAVDVTTDVDEALTACGDAGLCAQVIENLLINSAHALEDREDGRGIHIRADRVDQKVRIFVADNGPGIAEEIRARLFEPFVSTKAVGKGSGLGLAVSHGLMRAQDGDLLLVQTSAAGTEMGIELPWCAVTDAPAPVAPIAIPVERSALTLLIIDDDADMREMLLDATQDYFQVEMAATIHDAFARIRHGVQVDVVLCDLMMPDGGAEAWLEQCNSEFPHLADRTIIITGGPTTPEAAALTEARKDRVLYKPFSLTDMREMVHNSFTGKRTVT